MVGGSEPPAIAGPSIGNPVRPLVAAAAPTAHRLRELADKLDVLGGRFEGDQDSEMVRAECQKQDQRHRDTDQPKQR